MQNSDPVDNLKQHWKGEWGKSWVPHNIDNNHEFQIYLTMQYVGTVLTAFVAIVALSHYTMNKVMLYGGIYNSALEINQMWHLFGD